MALVLKEIFRGGHVLLNELPDLEDVNAEIKLAISPNHVTLCSITYKGNFHFIAAILKATDANWQLEDFDFCFKNVCHSPGFNFGLHIPQSLVINFIKNEYFSTTLLNLSSGENRRVDHFFMMSSPLYVILLLISYVLFVTKIGPKFMENRKPYNLNSVILIYDLFQVIVNTYLFLISTKEIFATHNWYCNPIDYTDTPHNRYLLRMVHVYFLVKISDLLDTVFFILRKKSNQLSFLHIYHHTGMIIIVWVALKYGGNGHSFFVGPPNCLVHAIMYSYYFLTNWNPIYKQKIWWKKYITQLQLVQFLFFIVIYGITLLQPSCTYPKVYVYFFVPQNIFMLFLFSDFYIKTYIKPKKKLES